ncbi:hypothetical protein SARC_11297 [Sphaeroforma arctica JP610]|uniref:Carrier domain-containing protein n=1 Tax=Sphaeroforma arctica JP610 TaxID=667725 RepID=A0A0L0FJJ4_9EUKA|nr:hypothetical protein SARC_11297 [Sphaeroforma arctica JP610]KNC76193.1 hypothetical protein SARC_11297 [Sphaeroforma arctica JP610]|eukprot:XP_014150095.1 hypothetical protein SARC_11297 [Sphaeroforma arctica JP610]
MTLISSLLHCHHAIRHSGESDGTRKSKTNNDDASITIAHIDHLFDSFDGVVGNHEHVDPSTVKRTPLPVRAEKELSVRISQSFFDFRPSRSVVDLQSVDWTVHWNTKMTGIDTDAIAVNEFPFDFDSSPTRLSAPHAERHSVTLPIPQNLRDSLHALCGQQGLNPSNFIAAAFGLLICKHTNTKDAVIGVLPEAGLIPVPLRLLLDTKMVGTPSVEALSLVQKVEAEMDFINRHTRKYRDTEAVQKVLDAALETSELEADFYRILVSASNRSEAVNSFKDVIDLALSFTDENHTSLSWTYNDELFLPSTINFIHDRMITVLNTICKVEGYQPLDGTVETLFDAIKITSAEEDRILAQFSKGKQRYVPMAEGLHKLFEQQVGRVGHKVAVSDEQRKSLTYADLNSQADILSKMLCALPMMRSEFADERRVAIMIPRSLTLFVALIAVLKAGAAYVPIDPTYSAQRIAYILEDSGADVLITVASTRSLVPVDFCGSECMLPNVAIEPLETKPELARINMPKSTPDKLFCVLYTSGTTGKPKGVGVEHHNALTFMANSLWDPIGENDVWAQMANFCFIGSMNDIWLPLVRGASTTIVPRAAMMDVQEFKREIYERGVTCTFMTPKLLELFADADPAAFEGLNVVQVAGEAVRLDAVSKLAGRAKHLQHLYGCTERTGCISGYEIPTGGLPDALQRGKRMSIGMPIENTSMHILDANMMSVPVGVVGQLYVGGDQITRGYLNRRDLTEAKFFECPRGRGRLYSTGDLARWLPDGSGVDLIGRTDSMVKIQGYRVELGEIEAAIMNTKPKDGPGITTSCVILRGDIILGEQVLVAYVTPASVSVKDVRAHLITTLPAYMVPAHLMPIASIPLNHNGKVDRRALPKPNGNDAIHTPIATRALTESETVVVKSWSELIGIPVTCIASHSVFTEFGGNSMRIAKLLSILRKYCKALELSDLLDNDTPEKIANRVDEIFTNNIDYVQLPETILKFSAGDGSGATPVFLIHGGSGVVDYGAQIGQFVKKHPYYGIQLTQAVAAVCKEAEANGYDVLHAVSSAYVGSVRAVQAHGPYSFAGNSLGALIAFEMTRILEDDGEVVERIVPMDMPVAKFSKAHCYRTATSYAEKAPMLLTAVWGRMLCDDTERVDKLLAEMDATFSQRLENNKDDPASAEEMFTQMESTMKFLLDLGMPREEYDRVVFGLSICGPLFQDLRGRGTVKADVSLIKCEDNRLMNHTLRTSGQQDMLQFYGWDQVTTGTVTTNVVPGDHVDMVSVGMKECAQVFDDC